jgi:hypothetical protein
LPLDATGTLTLAHELALALQQQRFDSRKLVEEADAD